MIAGRRLRQLVCRGLAVIAAMLLPGALFLAACSTLPSRDWPPLHEGALAAEYTVTPGQPIEVPVSSPQFVLLSMQIEPAPAGEEWRAGHRFLLPPSGCTHVTVRCRYRAYDEEAGRTAVERRFPGAAVADDAR